MSKRSLVQAVGIVVIMVTITSCAATKEYSSKIFPTRNTAITDSQQVALRFLDLENAEPDKKDWVTTDIIMGRDTSNSTFALDKFSQTYPAATPVAKDSTSKSDSLFQKPVLVKKTNEPVLQPVARNAYPGEVREKKSRE